uniref:Uncharacterized protein n=1 Tax=Cacopsylla melanoneura TaxID=428564 RepID=A0A8D8VIV6_9HEMI
MSLATDCQKNIVLSHLHRLLKFQLEKVNLSIAFDPSTTSVRLSIFNKYLDVFNFISLCQLFSALLLPTSVGIFCTDGWQWSFIGSHIVSQPNIATCAVIRTSALVTFSQSTSFSKVIGTSF